MKSKVILTTYGNAVALWHAEKVGRHLLSKTQKCLLWTMPLVTAADRMEHWRVEEGGLFGKELEEALLSERADIAIHFAENIPLVLPDGLDIAGYLPRGDAREVLVKNVYVTRVERIGVNSPRRRAQIQAMFPEAEYVAPRGTLAARLQAVCDGFCDVMITEAWALEALSTRDFPSLTFEFMGPHTLVPSAGQGAIAVECRTRDVDFFRPLLDATTFARVTQERNWLAKQDLADPNSAGIHVDEHGRQFTFLPKRPPVAIRQS
ncbi:MAG: hypothetical protein A2Y14_02310 [Verrucomicrobia bacterium GWF2_51_19]|nr:MAG: hypothetical protein A2Y14_02310 [Verrucomicrobia bacterium GWF2_51_19]